VLQADCSTLPARCSHGTPSTTDLSGRATLYGRHRCLVGLMPNSHGPPDPTRQSCLCRVRRCELSRPNRPTSAFCAGVRPAVAPAVPATQNALVGRSGRLRSHRPTRQSILSVSRLVCRCELDDCSERVQTSHFLYETVLSCRESNSHRRSGRDTDKTVLSCMARRCELALSCRAHSHRWRLLPECK